MTRPRDPRRIVIVCLVILTVSWNVVAGEPPTRKPEVSAERRPPSTERETGRLDWLIRKWEESSKGCDRHCYKFQSWQYDSVFGPKDTFKTYKEGVIAIAGDKWLYRTDRVAEYSTRRSASGKPVSDYSESLRVRWNCDGKLIHLLQYDSKRATAFTIPPERSHKSSLALLPGLSLLRLLGQVERDEIERECALRLIKASDGDSKLHWLEATPRDSSTWALFGGGWVKFRIGLDAEDFRPKVILCYSSDRTGIRANFRFREFVPNATEDLFSSRIPQGWKKDVVVLPSGGFVIDPEGAKWIAGFVGVACVLKVCLWAWW